LAVSYRRAPGKLLWKEGKAGQEEQEFEAIMV
jgi:hypothetical protein